MARATEHSLLAMRPRLPFGIPVPKHPARQIAGRLDRMSTINAGFWPAVRTRTFCSGGLAWVHLRLDRGFRLERPAVRDKRTGLRQPRQFGFADAKFAEHFPVVLALKCRRADGRQFILREMPGTAGQT